DKETIVTNDASEQINLQCQLFTDILMHVKRQIFYKSERNEVA
ncbi:734_t:CDS:1, partial [Racocetra fulgida]